jgi:hypothetical protein
MTENFCHYLVGQDMNTLQRTMDMHVVIAPLRVCICMVLI